jgi:hypothetical protein
LCLTFRFLKNKLTRGILFSQDYLRKLVDGDDDATRTLKSVIGLLQTDVYYPASLVNVVSYVSANDHKRTLSDYFKLGKYEVHTEPFHRKLHVSSLGAYSVDFIVYCGPGFLSSWAPFDELEHAAPFKGASARGYRREALTRGFGV